MCERCAKTAAQHSHVARRSIFKFAAGAAVSLAMAPPAFAAPPEGAAEAGKRRLARCRAAPADGRQHALRQRRYQTARFPQRARSAQQRAKSVRRRSQLRRFPHRPGILLRYRARRPVRLPRRRQFRQRRDGRQSGICRAGAQHAADPGARPRGLRRGRRHHQIGQGRHHAARPPAVAGRRHPAGGRGRAKTNRAISWPMPSAKTSSSMSTS